jgi:hypothetical protein
VYPVDAGLCRAKLFQPFLQKKDPDQIAGRRRHHQLPKRSRLGLVGGGGWCGTQLFPEVDDGVWGGVVFDARLGAGLLAQRTGQKRTNRT